MKEDDQEDISCASLLQEEYEWDPCAAEDPTIQHLVVGSVGSKITSTFFVGDIKIITKEDDVFNGFKASFVSDTK